MVRLLAVMNLKVQGVLHEVSLLLVAANDLDSPIVATDPFDINPRLPG
jgi:hypothetical protein